MTGVTDQEELTDPEALTIDALARRTGMTTRNIRAHQARGLLPAPRLRGRTGFYGPEHVSRLELIRELQAEGFNLEGIRRLIERAGGSSEEVLRFGREARASFADDEPRRVTLPELARRLGADDPALLERAVALGLVRRTEDGSWEEISPRLADAAAELATLGVPAARGLDVAEALQVHAEGVARTYVDLFLEQVWEPFDAAGRPPERWDEVRGALDRLGPLAADTLLVVFRRAMRAAIAAEIGRELEGGEDRPGRS